MPDIRDEGDEGRQITESGKEEKDVRLQIKEVTLKDRHFE